MIIKSKIKLLRFQRQSLVLHFIILSVLILAYFVFDIPILLLSVGGIFHTGLSIAVILLEEKNNLIRITPISVFFLYVFFSYGLAAVFIAIQLLSQDSIPFVNTYVYSSSLQKGYLINIVGIFFMHLGLQIFRPRKNMSKKYYSSSLPKLLTLFSIGILFLLNPILTIYFGTFLISSIVWLPVAIILYIVLTDAKSLRITTKQKKIIVLFLTFVVFALQVFSLSKLNILLSLLPLVWLLLNEVKNKWKTIFIFAFVMIFYSYFVYPFVTSARQNFVPLLKSNNLIGELSGSPEVRTYLLKGEYVEAKELNPNQNTIEAFMYRMFDSAPSGYISGEVERSGFTYGATLDYALYGLIPRMVWQGKPTTSRGGWFTRYLNFQSSTAIAMTSYGELYWNFGFTGVAIGMLIIGSLYAGLWRMAGIYPQSSLLTVWLYFLLLYGMMMHSEAGGEFLAIIQLYLIFGFMFFIRNSFFHKGKKLKSNEVV